MLNAFFGKKRPHYENNVFSQLAVVKDKWISQKLDETKNE